MPRPAVQRGSEPGQPLRAVVRNLHAPDFFQRAVRMGGVARQFRSVAVDLIEIRAVRRNPGVGRTADHGSVEPSGGAVSWNLWACGIARDFEAAAVDVETADVAVAEVRGEHRSVVRGHLQPAQLRGHACARVDLYDRADVDVAVFFDGAQADAIADSISDDEGIRPTVQEGNVERRAAPCVVELGRAQGAGPNECKTNSVPLEGAYASDFAVPLRPSTGFGGFAGGFVTPYHALLPEFALSAASVRSTRRCSLLKPMVVTRA